MVTRIFVLGVVALLASCATTTISIHKLSEGQPIEVSSPNWTGDGSATAVDRDK